MATIGRDIWFIVNEMNREKKEFKQELLDDSMAELQTLFEDVKKEYQKKYSMQECRIKRRICLILMLILIIGALCISIKAFAFPKQAKINSDWKSYLNLLSKAEKDRWLNKEQEKDGAYMQINQVALAGENNNRFNLGLINSPYSACDIEVVIKLKENETVVYESPVLQPGTVVEEADFQEVSDREEEEAIAYFSFYDGRGKQVKEEKVEIVLQRDRGADK